MKFKTPYLFSVCITSFICISLQSMNSQSTISPQDFFKQMEQCTDWPDAKHAGESILKCVTLITYKNIMQYCMTDEAVIKFGDQWTHRLLDSISHSGKKFSLLQDNLERFYEHGPFTLNQTPIDQLISYIIHINQVKRGGIRIFEPTVSEHRALAGLQF